LITVQKAAKAFGNVRALDGVDFELRRHEIHGLVGANGSGKTSLLNLLSGFSRLNSGSVVVQGRDVSRLSAAQIARSGIGRTFQTPRIFANMTLWENVRIGLDARVGAGGSEIERTYHDPEKLEALLAGHETSATTHGQRRVLEVIRVALQNTPVLLLDEPAAGLSPNERSEFMGLLRSLRDRQGKSIVLVEHDLDLVWGVADRITVLEAGRVIATGCPETVAADPAVQHLFVGSRK
jgi:branched-chain amino acid transport system permease protein